MTLPRDISRCVGRFGLGTDDPICSRRSECARYVALIEGDGEDETGSWNTISVATGLCRDGEDHFIQMAESE